MNNYTAKDDGVLCDWLGIEMYEAPMWEWVFPTVLSNPTPDTEAMVRDALLDMGYILRLKHWPHNNHECVIYTNKPVESVEAHSFGPRDGIIALAADELRKKDSQ